MAYPKCGWIVNGAGRPPDDRDCPPLEILPFRRVCRGNCSSRILEPQILTRQSYSARK
jgi:hypothetical protein